MTIFRPNTQGILKACGQTAPSSSVVQSTVMYCYCTVCICLVSGYWADCAPRPANPNAFNRDVGIEWWEQSAKAAGLDE